MSSTVFVEPLPEPRDTAPAQRASGIFASFDALSSGERLVVIARDAGHELLELLQVGRRGLFEWSVLEPGPPVWRIEITRRAAPQGARRAVCEALAWDHDRLDALEEAAFRSRAAGDHQAAGDFYAAFAAGLRRHIGFEEDLLFPAFEEKTGTPPTAGPTAVMRAEHREIRKLLERIEAGIADAAMPVEELRHRFQAVLADHNLKEEEVLYPATDDLLGEEEADRLVSRIQLYSA
jgi:regulator of cell morphogenesis and NO signaling